jgi:hypothetical protein
VAFASSTCLPDDPRVSPFEADRLARSLKGRAWTVVLLGIVALGVVVRLVEALVFRRAISRALASADEGEVGVRGLRWRRYQDARGATSTVEISNKEERPPYRHVDRQSCRSEASLTPWCRHVGRVGWVRRWMDGRRLGGREPCAPNETAGPR